MDNFDKDMVGRLKHEYDRSKLAAENCYQGIWPHWQQTKNGETHAIRMEASARADAAYKAYVEAANAANRAEVAWLGALEIIREVAHAAGMCNNDCPCHNQSSWAS